MSSELFFGYGHNGELSGAANTLSRKTAEDFRVRSSVWFIFVYFLRKKPASYSYQNKRSSQEN